MKLSRNTLFEYENRLKNSGKSFPELLKLTDQELSLIVYNQQVSNRKDRSRYENLSNQFSDYIKELNRTGVTRLILWEKYRENEPQGYSYQQFCEYLSRYKKVQNASMSLFHNPAETTEIDFAGDKLSYIDPSTGEIISCPVWVAVLPYSGYTFATALPNATLEHLIPAQNECVVYFGGITKNWLTDNMKQMVKKSNRYEPVFNDVAQQWSVHYNTSLTATRPGKPKDKPSVEKAVDLVYKRIFAPLRNEKFYSLSELNFHIRKYLDEHNNALMYKKDYSRKEIFLRDEKPLLTPLPDTPFEVKYTVQAKVQKNYHVILGQDWHQYSVPYQYIGKKVKIIYDSSQVEIFLDLKRIAFHKRNYRKNGYSTQKDHMPEKHKRYSESKGWDENNFLRKAEEVGENFTRVITSILNSRHFTEQTYNACLGLIRLKDKYGKERLETASTLALQSNSLTYSTIANILSNNMDKQSEENKSYSIPRHSNIRGSESYLNL
jgi:transposase